jgi:hypothetical protein
MDRLEAIEIIQSLYPADSEYPSTAAVGAKLLKRAQDEVCSWRTEPTDVLIRYAQLCMYMEDR